MKSAARRPLPGCWPARPALRALAIALCLGLSAAHLAAGAAEFRSVTSAAAVLYDAPSVQARKLYIAPRSMPLEVLSVVSQWVKVREMEGALGWVERAELGSQRTVVAKVPFATVRVAGQDSAEIVIQAERGVALELADPVPVNGWVKVRHRDGSVGFVRAAEVWGL